MAEGAQQQQWTPTLDYKQTRELIKTYNSNPQLFSNQLPKIRNHAQHHNIPFYEGDFSLVKALKQAGVGFVEGFTTLNIGKEHPDNEWVAVARSLGHLAGFAPGILSGPLGMLGKATKIESIKNAALAIRGVRGIPLKVAEDVIQPRATKMAQKALKNSFLNRTDAFRTFRKFVEKDVVEDIASGAFKLGTASAISSWQGGVDQMMHGFFSGAIFGGGFAALGNIIGKNVPGQKPFKVPVESEKAEKFARGLAGSLFQGLPSTVRGATTPEQIYEYLMGAYFGSREKPWTEKRASKELQKGLEEARKSPKSQFEEKLDPEMFSNWENIPTEVRPVLKKMAADWVGQQVHQAGMAGYELAKALKVPNLDKRIGKKPEDADEVSIVEEVTGVKPKKQGYYDSDGRFHKTSIITELTDAELVKGLGLNKLDTKLVNQTIDQIIKDNPNLKGKELQNKVRQTLMQLEANLTTTKLNKGFSNPDFKSIDQIVRYRTGEVKEPVQENIKPNVTNFPMNFKDGTGGRKMRPEFKGKSTMDLIESGDRTATSRSLKEQANKPVKKGDIVEMYDKNTGKKILVRATTDLYSLDKVTPEQWSQLEGWAPSRHAELLKRGYKQFRFELIKPKISKPVTPQENIKESRRDTFILTSGDKGIQQVVSQETYKAGLTEVQALNEGQGIPRHKTPNTEQIILKPETLDKANDSISKAIEVINQRVKDTGFGKEINTVKYGDYYLNILRRDAAKLDKNYVDTVISIEPLNGFMNETKGLSRIPIQIAINKGKKVFNFDEKLGWSKYNPKTERFEMISTIPELSRRTAFFGTNDPSKVQVGQIQNLFKNHVSRGFKEEIVAKVQKSEESDKIDTIEYSEAEMAQSAMDYKLSSIFQYGLNDIAKTIQSDNVARYNTIAKIADKAGKIVTGLDSKGKPFLEKGKRTNSLDWIDAIESQLRKEKGYEDVTLPDNVKRTLRQWLVTQNQAYPIYSGGYEPGEGINIIGPETPFTKSGVFRKQEGPMKLIEEVFIKASGKDIDTSKEPLIVNFSDITYKKSDGTKVDVQLSRIEQVIARDYAPRFQKYEDAVDAAKKVKSIIIKDIIKEMEKKHDMHIWGGEGDKDKMVFVKYHPDYKKVKLPELPKDSYEFALQEYGIDRVTRDKMTKSIIKYTEGLNDGRPIEQIAGQPGFIKNAIHDNKRNPLWMSNGWRGDKEFWKNTANHGQDLKLTKVKLPNVKVKYDANIKSGVSDRIVGARTDKANNQILIDPNRLLLDFQNKAWTKPKVKGVKPLPENAFKDYAEYEAFVIRHEKAHFLPENIAIKDLATKENHANDIALGKMDGNAKAVFVKSPAELESLIGVENAKILQSVDGGIIMTRPTGIAMRADKGVPDSGHEKSIAVIPSPDGTKLMKYMMHETTPEGSKMMENYVDPATGEVGINYIVYDSAVKQSGNFPIGNYKIDKGKLQLTEGAKIFEIDPGDFRYNYGVYDSVHSIGLNDAGRVVGLQAPKQMIMMPNDAYPGITNEVVKDYVDTLSGQSFKGQDGPNKKVMEYVSTKDKTLIDDIIKDFDNVGIKEIEAVLRDKGSEPLAEKMLLEILKTNKTQIETLMGEGEMSSNNSEAVKSAIDFNGTADNIIKHAAALKKPAISLLFDKYTRPYVENALNKFVANRVSKPKIKNSMKARIRPYDKFIQEKIPELNNDKEAMKKFGVTAEDLFFLDNFAKQIPIFAKIKGYEKLRTLEDYWKAFNTIEVKKDKKLKQEFLDIFDAVNIRVPVDAISGAQVLRFGGFTDVQGHGVLMHGRKIELLGGADHDADTAFVFFGGRKADGSGEGMKKEWTNMFRANKDEFISKKEHKMEDRYLIGEMIDPKKAYHKDIVLDKNKLGDLGINPNVFDWTNNTNNKHPYMQFTPDIRMYVGQNTAESRNAMGPVVSLTQNMRAGWHSVRQSVGKTEEIESGTITHKWKKVGNTKVRETLPPEKQFKFRVSRKAKEPNIEQQWLSSALIRFTADPANELGLIPFSKMKSLLNQLYFEKPLYEVFNPKKGTWTDISKLPKTEKDYWKNFFSFQTSFKRTLSDNHFKESRYDLIDNINRAFFGFDYINKKDFSYEQKQEMVKRLTDLSENELSTAMPKMGEMLREVDFRVSIYDKVDKDGYYAMMQKQKEIGKTLAKTTDYKKLLDRTVLYRPQSKYIDFAFDVNLNNPFVRKNFSENIPSLLKKLDEFGIKNDGKLFPKITKDDLPSEAIAKIKALEEVTKDFLSNSIDEIGTLNSIIERYGDALKAGKRIPESEMLEIAKEVEAIKQLSAAQYRKRKEAIYDNETTDLSRLSEAEKVLHKMYFPDVTGKKPTKLLDQSQLDARINAFKESLSSKYAKDVFDLRLLGSLRSENTIKKINEFLQSPKKDQKNELFRDVVKELYKTGAKSSTTKVAYDSNAVDSKNILRFLKAKNDLFTGISVEPPKKVETAIENLKKTKEFQAIQAESNIDIRKAAHPLVEVNGFENLTKTTKESKLFDWQKKEILELANWLKHEPDFKTERLNETIMGIYQKIDPQALSKTLDQININDVKLINKYFRTIKEGTAIQRIEDAVNKYKTAIDKASLKRRNHFQFVEGINEEMMREHLVFLPTQGFFKTKDGSPGKFATVYKPTYYGEVLMNWASRSAEQSSGKSAEINNKFINDLRFLNQVEEQGVNPLGLYQLAIARYELQTRDRKKLDKDWYQINWEQLKKHWDWDKSREANFNIDFGDGKGRVKVTGADIVNKIQSLHRETYDNLLSIQQGKPGALEKYHIPGAYWEGDITQPKLNWKKFRDDLIDDYNNNRLINIDIGSDGIRHMLKSYMAENMPITEYSKEFTNKDGKKVTHKINLKQWLSLPKKDRKLWTPDSDVNWAKLSKMKIFPTKNRAGYYPHLFNSKSEAMKGRTEEVAALQKRFKDGEISPEHYFNEWASIENKYARRLGDYNFAEYEMTDIVDMALFPELKKHLSEQEIKRRDMSNLPSVTQRAGHSYERSDHQPGWIIDPAVNTMYIKNTVDGMYRQISNFMTRITLNTMKEHMQDKWVNKAKKEDKKDGQELVNNWLTFWHNYAREAQGMPSVVTTEMWNNPKLYYSNTPAGWFADNIVSNKVNKIADKLGLTDKDMPEGLKGTKAIDMQKWSQVEARFQLATLMTHPKTPINNIFGGSLHTFQSVGYEPMRKARDYDYLQTLNPKWKTRKDVYDSMDKHGIQAELLRHEYGFDKSFQSGKNKKFMDDLSEKVAEGKEVTKELIVSTAKERGISERIVDIAGKYMSIPEKMLRTDAFLTHYIKAWERFGGAIKDPEHPFLIELAKKGVKATQFLYNAPNRPAIARSGLGKTMTRFQLWSWNAVRFRNDVRKQAKLYGFKPGTEAMKKFERMMQVDMFVLALGSVFMYSLFGQIIPAPYNWLQDTAEWVLGDEKERNKAFFGMYPGALAPLQMITPPIARFPIAAIREFAEDDYNKLADYYIYTMFPFGRQIRDLVHPESNIIENPMRAPEKLLGIPLTGMAKEAKKRKREPKFESSVPGLSMY